MADEIFEHLRMIIAQNCLIDQEYQKYFLYWASEEIKDYFRESEEFDTGHFGS